MEGRFNGELLRLARQYRGTTQRDLAAALDVDASIISRVENGVTDASEEFACSAASRLELPIEFFQQPDKVYGLPISVHPMWRKRAAVSQHDVDRALAELNIRIIHLRRLIRAVEYSPVIELPKFDLDVFNGDVEQVATLVRRHWLIPNGPISNLIELVERAGCFVIMLDLPDAAMDGVTLRTPDAPPCIFLNQNMPADRMRLTLGHELGHIVMHRFPREDMEREASRFSAALMVPAEDVRPFFAGRKIDLPLLAAMKSEWRVSMAALLYRAHQLGYVDKNQNRYMWQKFNALKIRHREPPETDFEAEKPLLMPKLLGLHLNELGYSIEDLGKILCMYGSELRAFYNLTRPEIPAGRPKLYVVA